MSFCFPYCVLGQVMCGNAVSALRTRRLLKNQKLASRQSSRPANLAQREVVSSLDDYSPLTSTEMNTSENKYDILEELRQWRFNNQAYVIIIYLFQLHLSS